MPKVNKQVLDRHLRRLLLLLRFGHERHLCHRVHLHLLLHLLLLRHQRATTAAAAAAARREQRRLDSRLGHIGRVRPSQQGPQRARPVDARHGPVERLLQRIAAILVGHVQPGAAGQEQRKDVCHDR